MTGAAERGQYGAFEPLAPSDGYHPLADHGLIGAGHTAALVCRDGAIPWLCVPRFDSPPLFAALLDARRGGRFLVAPEGVVTARQRYVPDTAVLVTELRTRDALVRLTDALVLRSGADLSESAESATGELLRRVQVRGGPVRLRVEVDPRGGADVERDGDALHLRTRHHDVPLHLVATRPLPGLRSLHDLDDGEELDILLAWNGEPGVPDGKLIDATGDVWRRWLEPFHYAGPRAADVRRSAITLKLLDHVPNGAIVAAPTSSLPEQLGGERNWDYRFTWIRDAAFSVYALRRIGLEQEATAFLRWVLDTVEHAERPLVVYDIDGGSPTPERTDDELEGYRGSAPVRWGNAAAEQRQNDVYGEVLDCAFQWAARGGQVGNRLWAALRPLVDRAASEWHEPDHGIWEVRTPGRPFTYSAALCHVALDRGARLADRFEVPGDRDAWRRTAARIAECILDEAWDPDQQALTGQLGGEALDASVLTLPLRRVVPADHPRMVATTRAVADHLGAGDGLLYRYKPEESPDGLSGDEGAFLLCSFWLVDNLTYCDRLDEAGHLFEALCGRAGGLGLLPEQVDPTTGAFLGNYPQAFSHVGLLSSAVTLSRALAEREGGEEPHVPADEAFRTAIEEAPPARGHAGG